ncbi:hypothetical protein S7335_1738 [Synechococcus sp. PCC 7335]|nr:hypothetical protein S7335_1738 [Synechococcus sp. PCC 7335]
MYRSAYVYRVINATELSIYRTGLNLSKDGGELTRLTRS